MKNAQLWKRILNEGIDALPNHICVGRTFAERIISARIIVDSSMVDPSDPISFDKMKNSVMPIPFDEFWVEYPKKDDWICGAFIQRLLPTPERKLRASFNPVIAFDGTRPRELPLSHLYCDDMGKFMRIDDHAEAYEASETILPTSIISSFVCQTLTLLGCKNIALRDHENNPKQVRRAMKRFGGNPDSYRYHTLIVRSPGENLNSPGIDLGTMPRHICRGHFAEYGPEFGKGLLFGKYEGRFFVPPHMRGNAKNGVVEKDYEVRS